MLTFYRVQFDNIEDQLRWMFVFGMLLVGNVIDNMSYVKPIVMILHIYLGIMWISTGFRVYKDSQQGSCDDLPLERVGIID